MKSIPCEAFYDTLLTRAILLVGTFWLSNIFCSTAVSDTFPHSYVLNQTRKTASGLTSSGGCVLGSLFGPKGVMRMCGTISMPNGSYSVLTSTARSAPGRFFGVPKPPFGTSSKPRFTPPLEPPFSDYMYPVNMPCRRSRNRGLRIHLTQPRKEKSGLSKRITLFVRITGG